MPSNSLVRASALALALLLPRPADTCGPFLSDFRFTSYHGALPGEFETGRLGVLRPHYYRADLLMAYRELSGVPLSPGEQPRALLEGAPAWNSAKVWLDARNAVPGAQPNTRIEMTRKIPGGDYQFYWNCLTPAFENAAATLKDRIATWGAASPDLAEWMRGQDQVFQNCSTGATIPQPLPSAGPLLAADRRYQIAAAEFYAEQYGEATAAFDAIASDASSPWHTIAPYLAARACIRNATIAGEDTLDDAARRLEAILADPARKPWHASVRGLLDFIRAQAEPGQRLVELGNQLLKPNLGPQLGRVLTDYTMIFDRLLEDQQNPPQDNDLAEWIQAFQGGSPATEKYLAQKTMPWLIAALAGMKPDDPAANRLIAAAHAVRPNSPAYASVTYYGVLEQIRAGQLDAARTWADQALAGKLPDSAANLVRAERLRLARNWTEFLTFAPRKPVAEGDDVGESPLDPTNPDFKGKPFALDADGAQPLNRAVPLKLWMDAATNTLLPRNLRADIARAAWVRAVILEQNDAARTLAGLTARLNPDLNAYMKSYLAATDPGAARFAAVFVMLRAPGFEPMVRAGAGRMTPIGKGDMFHDNWWAFESDVYKGIRRPEPGASAAPHEALRDLYPGPKFGPDDFLPPGQRSEGESEWGLIVQRAGNAVNFLCAETVAWARAHPQDSRVPEALHRAVQATRNGPADKASSAFSRQAFDLLHRRYPNSEWTKKTKYWY